MIKNFHCRLLVEKILGILSMLSWWKIFYPGKWRIAFINFTKCGKVGSYHWKNLETGQVLVKGVTVISFILEPWRNHRNSQLVPPQCPPWPWLCNGILNYCNNSLRNLWPSLGSNNLKLDPMFCSTQGVSCLVVKLQAYCYVPRI